MCVWHPVCKVGSLLITQLEKEKEREERGRKVKSQPARRVYFKGFIFFSCVVVWILYSELDPDLSASQEAI